MAITRPHRRDRRRVPNGTQGGPIRALSQILYTGNTFGTSISLRIVGPLPDVPAQPYDFLAPTSDVNQDIEGCRTWQAGAEIPIVTAQVDSNGVIQIAWGGAQAGDILVYIPPFQPQLAAATGQVSGGTMQTITI